MLLTRRRFFSLLPAPLIVSAANIMPVRALAESHSWSVSFAAEPHTMLLFVSNTGIAKWDDWTRRWHLVSGFVDLGALKRPGEP